MLGLEKDKFYVLFIGRLNDEQKNISLIKSVNILVKEMGIKNIQLLITRRGPDKRKLIYLVNELDLEI